MKDTGRKGKAKFKVGQVVRERIGKHGQFVQIRQLVQDGTAGVPTAFFYRHTGTGLIYCEEAQSVLRPLSKRERGPKP